MIKGIVVVTLILFSCGKRANTNEPMEKKETIIKKGIKYYKDFDIYHFTGEGSSSDPPSYPYVEYEEIRNNNQIRIKFLFNPSKTYEDFFSKEDDYYYQKSKYLGDGGFSENVFLYIKNGTRYQFIYYEDSLEHKNTPSEFFLNEISIENKQMRKTIVLKTPEKEYQPAELFKHGPNEIKIKKELIYSEMVETYSIIGNNLRVDSKISYWDGKTKNGEPKCYNLVGASINWYHYFGFSLKMDC
jgi:hypothetical protein